VQLLIDVCVFDNLIKYFCYQLHVDLFFFLTSSEDLPCRKKLTCPSWKWHLNRSSWKMQHTTANYTGSYQKHTHQSIIARKQKYPWRNVIICRNLVIFHIFQRSKCLFISAKQKINKHVFKFEDLPCRKKLTCPSWKWHLNRSSWKMQHTTANYTGNQYTFTCYFHFVCFFFILHRLWSYASWINNYLCNQCLLQLTLWFRILLDATLCDTVCQWLVAGRWFSPGTPVSSINKIARILITCIICSSMLHFPWWPV
jgi:hypothetical protein